MGEHAEVFLSYVREDLDAAERLCEALRGLRRTVWFDRDSLRGGQWWKREIKEAIRAADFFLPLLSDRSVTKRGTVQWEMREALQIVEESPPGRVFVIPVRLEECQPAYDLLDEIHWIDLFPDWQRGIEEIDRAMRMAVGEIDDSEKVPILPDSLPGGGPKTAELPHAPLAEGLAEAVEVVKDYAASRAIGIRVEGVLRGTTVPLERAHLTAMLANILQNAIKFSYTGSSSNWITVRTSQGRGFAEVEVENWGKAVNPSVIKSVLAGRRGAHTAKDAGIGLYLSQLLLERAGGAVSIESKPVRHLVGAEQKDEVFSTVVRLRIPESGASES